MSNHKLAQQLQQKGRGGDTILAHINPAEAALLKAHGGSGTRNPETGLLEFGIFNDPDGWWKSAKQDVAAAAPVIIPIVAFTMPALIPAIGASLGASVALAPVVGAAALSAGVSLVGGGSLKDALTSAALAGTATYLTPILGSSLTPGGTSAAVQGVVGAGAFAGGLTAARGGTVNQVLASIGTGAANAYIGNLVKDALPKISPITKIQQSGFEDAVFMAADTANLKAAGLTDTQIKSTLLATGASDAAASAAVTAAMAGKSAADIATAIATIRPYGSYNNTMGNTSAAAKQSITAGNTQPLQTVTDSVLLAKDATQLAAQGLSKADIAMNLRASGVSAGLADQVATQATAPGATADTIADFVQSVGNGQKMFGGFFDSFLSTGVSKDIYNNNPTVERASGVALTAQQVDKVVDTELLTKQGYSTTQIDQLQKAGYSLSDMADMAAVGITPANLTTMSNTKFAESDINGLLKAGASVNDISYASRLIDNNLMSQDTAQKLLAKDYNSSMLGKIQNNAALATKLADSTLTPATVNTMLSQGYNMDQAVALAAKGVDVNKIISTPGAPGYTDALRSNGIIAPPAAATPAPVAPVAPAAITPTQALVNTGFTADEAAMLASQGYTAAQATQLKGLGYEASDLVDLAAAGVAPSTLTTLANTPFPETQINDLMSAGASANDISYASTLVSKNTISMDTATKLLMKDYNSSMMYTASSKTGLLDKLANSNLDSATTSKLMKGGWDINKAIQLADSGVNVNDMLAKDNWTGYRAAETELNKPVTPTAPVTTAPAVPAPVTPTQQLINTGFTADEATLLNANGYTAAQATQLKSLGYEASDLVDLAAAGVAPATLTTLANTKFAETQINDLMGAGASANDISGASRLIDQGKLNVTTATQLLMKDYDQTLLARITQPNNIKYLDQVINGKMTTDTVAKLTNGGWDLGKAMQLMDAGIDVNDMLAKGDWTGYRKYSDMKPPANTIAVADQSGKTVYYDPATGETKDYTGKVIGFSLEPGPGHNVAGGDNQITVSGLPRDARTGLPEGVTLPANTRLANPEEYAGYKWNDAADTYVASNGAYYDQATNSWVMPIPQETEPEPTPPDVELPPIPSPVGPEGPPGPPADVPIGPVPPVPPPIVEPPAPVVQPPVVEPPVVQPPVVEPPPPPPPVVQPPVVEPPPPPPPVVQPPYTPPVVEPPPPVVLPPVNPNEPPVVEPPVVAPPTNPNEPPVVELPVVAPPTNPNEPPVVEPPVVAPPTNPNEPPGVAPPQPPAPPAPPPVVEPLPPLEPLPPGLPAPPTPPPGPNITEPEPPIPPPILPPSPPYVPVPPPIVPPVTPPKTYDPINVSFQTLPPLATPGLNPGWIQGLPHYQAKSPVQSQYYWGTHPYQPGPTFDPVLYNQVPAAPVVPWGLQEMYTPTDINQYLAALKAK